MNLPRVSIVTPSYNHARYVEWTVRSVLLQRYPNLEYIVMDGGSTDGTCEKLAPYLPYLAHFVSEKDGGQAYAIARGLGRATGEIMAYLNSDDLLAPDALHYVAEYFRTHPDVDALYSHRCLVDADNRVTGYWVLPPHCNRLVQRSDWIPQETCFWRRRLLDAVGNVDVSYRFAMDYDLFVRFMRRGRMARVNRVLGAFRVHEDSKTTRLLATIGEEEKRRVLGQYGLTVSRCDRLLIKLALASIRYRSWYHVRARRVYAGTLPGVGYDYDDVWGGRLREKRLPLLPDATRASQAA